jgi:hypothetical protein
VLTVSDSEHNVVGSVGDNEVTCWKLPNSEMCGKIPGGTDPVSRLYFSRGRDGSKFLIILIYNCYICILLIKTNSMIYICYIFCKGGVEIYVLTVRDNEHDSEHDVGDNEVALSDVAEGGQRGKARGSHTDEPGNNLAVVATEPDFRWAGNRGIIAGYREFKERLSNCRRSLQYLACHLTCVDVTIRWYHQEKPHLLM